MSDRSILSFDFSEHKRKNELWLENRSHRRSVYDSLGEYIEFLEKLRLEEKDDYQVYLIEKRIKKLKKEQAKYYDIPLLAMELSGINYDEEKEVEESKALIKRMFKKKI